jgi:competence protein ComEC
VDNNTVPPAPLPSPAPQTISAGHADTFINTEADGDRFRFASSLFGRRRPLFWLALSYCAGIVIDAFAAPGLRTLGGLAVSVFLASAAMLFVKRGSLRGWRGLAFGALASLCVGMLMHALQSRIPPASDISRRTPAMPSFTYLRGTIVESTYSAQHKRTSWTLSVDAIGADAGSLTPATGKIQLRVRSAAKVDDDDAPQDAQAEKAIHEQYGEGDRVELRARIEAPPEVTLPNAFDHAAYLHGQGIRRVGIVAEQHVTRVSSVAWWRPDLLLRRGSSALSARVTTLLGDGEYASQSALLNALLFGRREDLDSSDREAFAVSGTAHLLAISGLQIQFLALLLWAMAGWLGISRRPAAWAVLIFSCSYCALAGADAPIMRATVMIVFYLAAVAFSREADPLNVLAASAVVILLVAPAQLFNAGFQLSYLAVLSLVTIYPALEECWRAWKESRQPVMLAMEPEPARGVLAKFYRAAHRWWTEALPTALFVSLASWVATAPAVVWHMGRFSTLSLLINLVAVPLSSLCMILGLAMLAVSAASTLLAGILAACVIFALLILQKLAAGFAALPLASIELPPPVLPLLAVYAAVLVWIWIERRRALSFSRFAMLLPLCFGALLAGGLFSESPAAPSITVLDLNYGRSALVETPSGGAALIDAGGLGQGPRIAEVLRRRGIARLEMLVISADDPEAIDGALDLVKRVPAARVILPRASSASRSRRDLEQYLTTRDIPYGAPKDTEQLHGPGEVRWQFVADSGTEGKPSATESVLNLRVSLAGTRVLFVNARSSSAMQRLLARGGDDFFQADVLRLTSSGGRWPNEVSQLMRQSGCRTIIAGSGADPRETPGADIFALAAALNLRLLSTHDSGSIKVQADVGRGGSTLQSFRNGVWKNE